MKVVYTFLCISLFLIPSANAQPATLQPAPNAVYTIGKPSGEAPLLQDRDLDRRVGNSEVVTDTVLLPTARRSSQRGIILNTTGSITGAYQYYGAPQPITLTGFEFYAYKSSNSSAAPMKCEVYEAAGNLPVGSPLFSTIVNVPYSSTSTLSQIRRIVHFANPITLNTDYALVIQLTTADEVVLASNNWDTQDGDGDYFAGGMFSGVWLSGSSISVGSPAVPFDADFFMQPHVKYTIKAGMKTNTNCLTGNDTITFDNTSSPVLSSKFYNKLVFLDPSLSRVFRWTFGDGSPPYDGFEPNAHVYQTIQKYTITKRDSLLQWSFGDRNRIKIQSSLDQQPIADFTFSGYRNITFQNQSLGIDKVKWIFSDSTYSTLVDPIYYFFGEGAYNVTLIVQNGCGVDSVTKTVQIAPIGINKNERLELNIFPNPASDQLILSGNDLKLVETIELVDLTGRLALHQTIKGADQLSLKVGDLSRGWYLLKMEGSEISLSRPVVLR